MRLADQPNNRVPTLFRLFTSMPIEGSEDQRLPSLEVFKLPSVAYQKRFAAKASEPEPAMAVP